MGVLSRKELRDYLEAAKQRICEKYGEFTDRTIREFIEEGCAEGFHDNYFREHRLDR